MITIEHTDTYGGESNYSWVNRFFHIPEGKPLTDRQAVMLAKHATGLTGIRCRVEHIGDMIAIYPQGVCHVIFIGYDEDNAGSRGYWRQEIDRKGETVTPKYEGYAS